MSTELLFCQRDHKYQVYASDHFGVACQIDLTGKANSKPELPDPLAHAAQQMICSLGEDPCRWFPAVLSPQIVALVCSQSTDYSSSVLSVHR